MDDLENNFPDWTGQSRLPWIRSALVAGLLHPSGGLRWLAGDGFWIENLFGAARTHPEAAFAALWISLMALSPWKSLRTDLTDTSIRA